MGEAEHNQNNGCSGGTDFVGISVPEQRDESEDPVNNLSNSLMKLVKRESNSMSDDETGDLLS